MSGLVKGPGKMARTNGPQGISVGKEIRLPSSVTENDTNPRHHVYAKTSHKDVQLAEVGPRFEAKRKLTRPESVLCS